MTIESIVLLLYRPRAEHCVCSGASPLGRKCSGKSKEEQGLAGCCVQRKPSRAGLHSLWGSWLTGGAGAGELAVLNQPSGSDTVQGSQH